MELLTTLLGTLGTVVSVAQGGFSLYQWLVGYIKGSMAEARSETVRQLLQDLGSVSDSDVRRLVNDWAREKNIPDQQCEELIPLLINLTHGARFHSTHGTPTSGFIKNARLIDQILSNLQPERRRDEAVGPGREDWRLDKFLGMGAFGEVWLARNRHFPEPAAFKFFTQEGGKAWFERERQALYFVQSRLPRHPNIIEFKNLSTAGQKWPFLELEFAGGGSLEEWILNHPEDPRRSTRPKSSKGSSPDSARPTRRKSTTAISSRPTSFSQRGRMFRPRSATSAWGKWRPCRDPQSPARPPSWLWSAPTCTCPPKPRTLSRSGKPAQDDVFALGVIWYQLAVESLERPPYDFAERLLESGQDTATIRLISRCLAQPRRRFPDACALEEAFRTGPVLPWPVPPGCFNVQPLVEEYLGNEER